MLKKAKNYSLYILVSLGIIFISKFLGVIINSVHISPELSLLILALSSLVTFLYILAATIILAFELYSILSHYAKLTVNLGRISHFKFECSLVFKKIEFIMNIQNIQSKLCICRC